MHYHLEIIMPSVDDVKAAITSIMEPFNEDPETQEDTQYSFWDFYIIGGRFSGSKLRADFDETALAAFYESLKEAKITVSVLQAGKQEISPASQIPTVDALWREHFPTSPTKVCPLFAHYNNQYEHSSSEPDIMCLGKVSKNLTAGHVIIAGPNHKGEIVAQHMMQDEYYNGVNFQQTAWDKNIFTAIEAYKEKIKRYNPEYVSKNTPTDDWLVVTVDYHS